MLDRKLSRRQLLQAGAAGAAAAALLPLGPCAACSRRRSAGKGNGRLIAAGKVGTITFTQRDVPGRHGDRRPGGADHGLPRRPELPGGSRPISVRSCRCPAAGGALRVPGQASAIDQIEFAGYGQNAANPGGSAPNPAPGGDHDAGVRAAYLAYAAHPPRLPRRLRPRGDRQPRLHPEHLARPEQPRWRDVDQRLRALPDRARVRVDPRACPYMGTGNDPTSANNRNIEPWTIAGEKWEALNELSARRGASTSTRTTTRRPTTSCRTARWSTVTEDRADRRCRSPPHGRAR